MQKRKNHRGCTPMADLQEMLLRVVGCHPNSEPGRARSNLDLGETTMTEGREDRAWSASPEPIQVENEV